MGPPFPRSLLHGGADAVEALMANELRWLEWRTTRGACRVLGHGRELGCELLFRERSRGRHGGRRDLGRRLDVITVGIGFDRGSFVIDVLRGSDRRADLPLDAIDPYAVQPTGDPLDALSAVRDALAERREVARHSSRAVLHEVVLTNLTRS